MFSIFTAATRPVLVSNFFTFLTAIGGISVFNYFRNPDTQSIQGIDNRTIMVIAVAGVIGIWLTRGKR